MGLDPRNCDACGGGPCRLASTRYEFDSGDGWQDSRPSPRWRHAIATALDLLPVVEVTFTLGSDDGSRASITYRKKVSE